MGLIARVVSFVRNGLRDDVKVNLAGRDFAIGQHYGPVGDDSPPLPNDYVAVVPHSRAGSVSCVAYGSTDLAKVSEPGEIRRVARDSTGAAVSEIHQRGDGTILITNYSGVIEMQPSGDVIINGVVIDTASNITTSAHISTATLDASAAITAGSVAAPTVTAGPVSLGTHVHSGDSGGTTSPPI